MSIFNPSDEKILKNLERRGGPNKMSRFLDQRPWVMFLYFWITWTVFMVLAQVVFEDVSVNLTLVTIYAIGGLFFAGLSTMIMRKINRRGIELWDRRNDG